VNEVVHVRDLFDIPEQVRKGDFVVNLADGVTHAEETAKSYVVTHGVHDALDKALSLVKDSIERTRSQAAFVHGSFGSGKSHFLAVLSLLIGNHEAAWRIPEVHDLRKKHEWVGTKKVLQLRFHMGAQKSLEAAVFGEYVRYIHEHFPDAPVPPLFADEALFENAKSNLERFGEEKFFGPMNPAPTADAARWGTRAATGFWTRATFDEAVQSTVPERRAKLFDALVRSHFPAFAKQKEQFLAIDEGLEAMARHAHSIGFHAITLFLDELVLWLAGGAGNASWMHMEVEKTTKLVEAQNAARAIPIVSFIARQRDLADLVGEALAGAENNRLRELLDWSKERFDIVKLEDNNLPEIASLRLLRAKDSAARKTLDDGFDQLQRKAGASWSTLLGSEDAAAFKKLYPFSPALVETLVALSAFLQRNRTAMRLLMEILVDRIPDLELGQLVAVGDLFDVLAGGEDAADGVMKARFFQAKQIYTHRLLPMIRQTNGTESAARCQRLRPEYRVTQGCSACPEGACRADNRIIKTMLLQALVPEVKSLKGLTASRVVQLNHGTLKAPIAGTEASLAAQRLRTWASALGQIHVGKEGDPSVTIDVGGVDLEPILQQARDADTPGARQKIVRDILFASMGLDPAGDWGQDNAIEWRGTMRKGHIRFGNVRRMTPEQLRCPETHDWRLVLDYPFDDPGFGPNDDLGVIEVVREEHGGTWTLVMLPSFFSEGVNKLLGELAILEKVLETRDSQRHAVNHLRVEQQEGALLGLRSLRDQKRARLESALHQAYGLARETEQEIDTSRSLQNHFYVLKPEMKVQPPIGGSLDVARQVCVPALLDLRYPRHPHLRKITKQLGARVIDLFGELLEADGKRLRADKEDLEKMRGTLEQLGIVRTSEDAIHLVEDRTLQDLDRKRAQKSIEQPTVGDLRSWLDEGRRMGLLSDAGDLVVRAYARWGARTLVRYDKPYEAVSGTAIPDDVTLVKPELPTPEQWAQALDLAERAFAIALPRRALHADNLKRFEVDVTTKAKAFATAAAALPAILERRIDELHVDGELDRLKTARSASALCAALAGRSGVEQVRTLAAFQPETSAKALGKSLQSAAATVQALENKLIFGNFERLLASGSVPNEILVGVATALRQDEVLMELAPRLRTLAEAASEALRAMAPAPPVSGTGAAPPVPELGAPHWSERATKRDASAKLAVIAKALDAALAKEAGDVDVEINVVVRRRR
jgi:hypothetical protein